LQQPKFLPSQGSTDIVSEHSAQSIMQHHSKSSANDLLLHNTAMPMNREEQGGILLARHPQSNTQSQLVRMKRMISVVSGFAEAHADGQKE